MFGWFKKEKRVVRTIDIHEHIREFMYDSQLVAAERLAVILGATPISKEGEDHARELSDARVARISSLAPIVHSYAHLVSDAMVELEKIEEVEDEDEGHYPPEFWDMMRTLLEHVALSVSLGVLSQSVELGLIEVKAK